MMEWVKVHTNKRVQHESSTGIDGDYFYFKGGSIGIIKILEPMNPQLNYYEYLIVSRGQKAGIGIGVCMPLRGTPLHYLRAFGLGLGPCACMHACMGIVVSSYLFYWFVIHTTSTSSHTVPHVRFPLYHICTHHTPHPLTQVGERAYPMDHMPGWKQNSCGYHADNLIFGSGRVTKYGPTCTDGDRMGCGVDFSTDHSSGYVNVFFTKNGKQVRRGRRRGEKKEVEG